jgi:hypothetical protein
MENKEERILCNSYDGIQAKLMANNNIGMTRQEAIEVMAKAIRNWEFPYSPRQIGWEDLSEDVKNDYENMAEAALKALLGEK